MVDETGFVNTNLTYITRNGWVDPDDNCHRVDIDLFRQAELYTLATKYLTFASRVEADGQLTSLYTFKANPLQWQRFVRAVEALDETVQLRRQLKASRTPRPGETHD